MLKLTAVLGLALLAGCASSSGLPNLVSAPADAPVAQVMSCVTQEIDELGYQPTTTNEMGPIRGERVNDEPFWLNIIGINDTVDVLDATFSGGQLRMAAYTQVLRGQERFPAAPRDDAIVEAQTVVDSCS